MRRALHALWALGCALLLAVPLLGCRREQAQTPAEQAGRPTVRIVAYINVSSGCQEPTIKLLRQLEEQHPDRVQLEVVDFGDEGEGNQRWKSSGYDCMTIEIDGSPLARFDVAGKPKTVALRQPVGFWWTHEDLRTAVAAAVDGSLQRGTEEGAIAGQPSRKIKANVVAEEVKRDGRTSGRVLINERPAMLIRVASGKASPGERAELAARVIRDWLKNPVKPDEIDREQVPGGWAVRVKGQVVAVATPTDAKAAGGAADQVAKRWLVGIRQGIAIAARPAENASGTSPEKPDEEGCETGG